MIVNLNTIKLVYNFEPENRRDNKMKEYNTHNGIMLSLNSLKDFNQLISDRRKAYYENNEELTIYYILGRYILDSCGNIGTMTDFIPIEHIPNIPMVLNEYDFHNIIKKYDINKNPDVLSKDDFHNIIKKYDINKNPDVLSKDEIDNSDFNFLTNKRPYPTSISYGFKNNIPSENEYCIVCKKQWGVFNCHDVLIRNNRYIHHNCISSYTNSICEKHIKENGINYGTSFINLAGVCECDEYIKTELKLAGIQFKFNKEKNIGEVSYQVYGKLDNFTFFRAWRYWVVKGNMPLNLANILYENPIGKNDIRVAGHCGCPAPKEWSNNGYITSYHIDSLQGLKLFANTIKII